METEKLQKFTRSEVEKHKNETDIWIIIEDNVYDVTRYFHEHPGGEEVLTEVAGRDGTLEFIDAKHSSEAREIMAKYKIGELVDTEKTFVKSSIRRVFERIPSCVAVGAVVIGVIIAYRIYRSSQ